MTYDEHRIDVSQPVADLCRAVGLDSKDVARIEVTPSRLEARCFRRNHRGKIYLNRRGEPESYRAFRRIRT